MRSAATGHRSALGLTCGLALSLSATLGCSGELGGPGGANAGSAGTGGSTSGAGGSSGASGTSGASTGGVGNGTGTGGAGVTGGTAGSGPATCTDIDANETGTSVLRRLTKLEYGFTLQDLFALSAPPNLDGIPEDNARDGFRTSAADQPVMDQQLLRAYLDRAKALASELMTDTARRTTVLGCDPAAADCLPAFVARFGKLAYRRPLEQTEIDGITMRATTVAADVNDRYRFAIESLLSSPSFLFRIEVGSTPDALATLEKHELAARLSFAIWGRGPSVELLDAAAAGALDTPAGLLERANAMLADPKTRVFFNAFFQQWLGYETLMAPAQPPMGWSNSLLDAMKAETDRVTGDVAWGGGSFLDALTANTTNASPALATFFGLPTPAADGTVTFGADHVRANSGLLTHPSLLSAKRDGDLIAIRGNWLRSTFLCEHLGLPADADTIGERLVGLTRVEIVNMRNSEQDCSGCHATIDPIGIGFAAFDAVGRFDATADLSAYVVTPALPDAVPPEFSSIGELAQKLHDMPQVPACLAGRTFLYMHGRTPNGPDGCAVERASRGFVDSGYAFPSLIRGLIEAPAFRLRRPPT
ncbi:MAG TPA: DUF1592 domain-containing protein [Polyangiaceae bacterium]|nr:DUF1592 domain-containing protein [Polyangiaceae bacterium]